MKGRTGRRRSKAARYVADCEVERTRLGALASGAIVVGVDEAGVGSWAGPVVAAAVHLNLEAVPVGLADSKQLSAARREFLFDAIMAGALVGVGVAEVDRIDRCNVLAASHWAMASAIAALPFVPDLALVDGLHMPALGCAAEAFVRGDAKVASIAAASIVAKVTRDRLMDDLGLKYPGYGFERHKGYGTPQHQRALGRLGVVVCHRRSFNPIKALLALPATKSE